MRLAALIIGLAVTAFIGFQSMTILTTPFVPRVYSDAATIGVMTAIAFAVGAGFSLSAPKTSAITFGIAAFVSLAAGSTTPYTDLTFWGVVGIALAVLSIFASRQSPEHPATIVQPEAQAGAAIPLASMPNSDSKAEGTPPSGETDIVAHLERLSRLQAAGAISDEEFANLKANLISHKAN